MHQYLLDHQRVFDAGDDFHAATADTASFGVDIEHALQALCPAHRYVACDRLGRFWPRCFGLITPAAPGRRHPRSVLTVGREHTVIARQIHPWFGHQRRQMGNEVQGLENDMGGRVLHNRLEVV